MKPYLITNVNKSFTLEYTPYTNNISRNLHPDRRNLPGNTKCVTGDRFLDTCVTGDRFLDTPNDTLGHTEPLGTDKKPKTTTLMAIEIIKNPC